jgi:hypothetical protein
MGRDQRRDDIPNLKRTACQTSPAASYIMSFSHIAINRNMISGEEDHIVWDVGDLTFNHNTHGHRHVARSTSCGSDYLPNYMNRGLLEKLTVAQFVKKFTAFHTKIMCSSNRQCMLHVPPIIFSLIR